MCWIMWTSRATACLLKCVRCSLICCVFTGVQSERFSFWTTALGTAYTCAYTCVSTDILYRHTYFRSSCTTPLTVMLLGTEGLTNEEVAPRRGPGEREDFREVVRPHRWEGGKENASRPLESAGAALAERENTRSSLQEKRKNESCFFPTNRGTLGMRDWLQARTAGVR